MAQVKQVVLGPVKTDKDAQVAIEELQRRLHDAIDQVNSLSTRFDDLVANLRAGKEI